jgi:hypothetical protein
VELKCFAKAASPQPRSATTSPFLLVLERRAERSEMKTSMGFVGQDWTWCLKPWWYCHQHSANTREGEINRGVRSKKTRREGIKGEGEVHHGIEKAGK